MAQIKEIEGGAPSKVDNENQVDFKENSSSINAHAHENRVNISSTSSILCITKTSQLRDFLASLHLSTHERNEILSLCEWIKSEKLSIKICQNIKIGEIILSYFSALSPTNPSMIGCFKRWVHFRSKYDDIYDDYGDDAQKLRALFDSGVFSIGFDNEERPVCFINTEFYNDAFEKKIIRKACILLVFSLSWNMKQNKFDTIALRKGICVYLNLSHWSVGMAPWNVLKALKTAMEAAPFYLVNIYVLNMPKFMYIIQSLVRKLVQKHAMDKIVILDDENSYFHFAKRELTPRYAQGKLSVTATQWMSNRGFLASDS